MARGRKSNSGVTVLILIGGLLALLQAIPREIWVVVGIVTAIGIVIYIAKLFGKSDEAGPESSRQSARKASLVERSARQRVESRRLVTDDEPVSVAHSSRNSDYKVPAAPWGRNQASWIPSGQSVTVAKTVLPGGMLYVGTSLPTPFGNNDPCLIDPSKSVAKSGDYTERQIGYWPSYAEISSSARRAYLNWLAGGRNDPEADIGYVFLFFYGLERRSLIDASKDESARADWPLIAAELRRLLSIYGEKSHSFRRYAGDLLSWVSLAEYSPNLYNKPVPVFPKTIELPIYIRLALGQAAMDGAPVPSHLALAWARLDPSVNLRKPAVRCSQEFEKLFLQKYEQIHGQGIVLPRNRTKLKLAYRAASAGFRGNDELKLTFKDTPDVSVLTAPVKKLQEIVDAATTPLEGFSRLVGKNADARSSLESLLLLPVTLWPESAQKAMQTIKERMGGGMVTMPFQELLNLFGAQSAFTKAKTLSLARSLESVNIGLEPDVLSGVKLPKGEDKVALFALPAADSVSRGTGPYLAAAVTLQLASAVAFADGEFSVKEMNYLREVVLSWKHLTPGHTLRLLAHLRLLTEAPASLTTLKKKFESLEQGVKETIASFMATVAQSDGDVSPKEVKILERVYKSLGVEPKRVFSDVHAVTAGTIPAGVESYGTDSSNFRLDPARIAALQKDTEQVSALLGSIFMETDEPAQVQEAGIMGADQEVEPPDVSGSLLGLDEAHAALARMLLSRPQWGREDLQDVAADLDLMLDGALEHINESAFDRHDMPLFEGENPITVNHEILEKIEP